MEKKKRDYTFRILMLAPVIVAAFVLTGVFAGFYFGQALGVSNFIAALLLSMIGFFASLPVVWMFVTWMIKKESD
jgi:hypothetical protein